MIDLRDNGEFHRLRISQDDTYFKAREYVVLFPSADPFFTLSKCSYHRKYCVLAQGAQEGLDVTLAFWQTNECQYSYWARENFRIHPHSRRTYINITSGLSWSRVQQMLHVHHSRLNSPLYSKLCCHEIMSIFYWWNWALIVVECNSDYFAQRCVVRWDTVSMYRRTEGTKS